MSFHPCLEILIPSCADKQVPSMEEFDTLRDSFVEMGRWVDRLGNHGGFKMTWIWILCHENNLLSLICKFYYFMFDMLVYVSSISFASLVELMNDVDEKIMYISINQQSGCVSRKTRVAAKWTCGAKREPNYRDDFLTNRFTFTSHVWWEFTSVCVCVCPCMCYCVWSCFLSWETGHVESCWIISLCFSFSPEDVPMNSNSIQFHLIHRTS